MRSPISTNAFVNGNPAYPLPLGSPSLPRRYLVGRDTDQNEVWTSRTPLTDPFSVRSTSSGSPRFEGWWRDVELPTRSWYRRRFLESGLLSSSSELTSELDYSLGSYSDGLPEIDGAYFL